MKKSYWLTLVLSIMLFGYGGMVDVRVAFGQQGDVYSSGSGQRSSNSSGGFKRCGVNSREMQGETFLEIPLSVAVSKPMMLNGKKLICRKVTGGNCQDNSTAICWDPATEPPKYIQGGIDQSVQQDPGTGGYYDRYPTKVNPPMQGGANSNNGTLRGGADTGDGRNSNLKPFDVTLNLKGQKPIYISYKPPYALNEPQPIFPPKGNSSFKSATGRVIRGKNKKLKLEVTDLTVANGGYLGGPFYVDLPPYVVLR